MKLKLLFSQVCELINHIKNCCNETFSKSIDTPKQDRYTYILW